MTASNLSRYNGLTSAISCPTGFSSNKHTMSGYSNNRPGVEFTMTPDVNYEITVTSISVDVRRNNKGPVSWRIAYSTDGGTSWTNSGTDVTVSSITCGTNTNVMWDVTDFTSTSTITVRLIGHSAYSNLNGISTLMNVDVQGSVDLIDADGDGYGVDVDCDDANAGVNPGATEVCNGIDDNCDGNIDEGVLSSFYADGDGDGYGNAAISTTACSAPDGYVSDNTDCDDTNAGVNPGATEVCNGIDDNCDGNIDEGVLSTFYADNDGDGYGDASTSTMACSAPDGYVSDNTDCNDAIGAINPGATELCNGFDDDCDGSIDEDIDLSMAISPSGDITLCKPESVTLSATAGYTSYQWYKNGDLLSGETASTYTTNHPGYYQVRGFIGTCVSDLSAVQAVAVVESPNANISAPYGNNLCPSGMAKLKASYDASYTYVWYQDGSEIIGATDYIYYATATGDYYYVVTNASGCSRTTSTITVIDYCKLGAAQAQMMIYPNPANDVVNIAISALQAEDAFVSITDLTGRVLYTERVGVVDGNLTSSISLSDAFSNGVYMLTITAGETNINRQFVVTR